MASSFMVIDMGLHSPKPALPEAMHMYRSGRYNERKQLPPTPINYFGMTTIYHAYTRDLHLRSLHFAMADVKEWMASFFTAPGAIECMLGLPTPFIVCLRISGDWSADEKNVKHDLRASARPELRSFSRNQHGYFQRARRFFQVRVAVATTGCDQC